MQKVYVVQLSSEDREQLQELVKKGNREKGQRPSALKLTRARILLKADQTEGAPAYTDAEIAYCRGRPSRLAARFAAKEAVAKALGVGIFRRGGVYWRDVEVTRDRRGKPGIRLSGGALERARQEGLSHWALSLSHSREHAVAMVVATKVPVQK